MRRKAILTASVVVALAIVAGCGGGGGGTPPPPSNRFLLTGVVRDWATSSPIVGARVTVETTTVLTGSDGRFRFELLTTPVAPTYSVDGRDANPQCQGGWASVNGVVQDGEAIKMPLPLVNPTDLGVILLNNVQANPPMPPIFPSP